MQGDGGRGGEERRPGLLCRAAVEHEEDGEAATADEDDAEDDVDDEDVPTEDTRDDGHSLGEPQSLSLVFKFIFFSFSWDI